jgi:hydroxyacylglutathione hydrolase
MNVQILTLGPVGTNCFIVWNRDGGNALVIDPSSEATVILDFLDRHRLRVTAYLLTHGHVDHLSALSEAHRARPAPVAMHPEDQRWAFLPINQLPPFYPPPPPPPPIERALAEGQTWTDGDWSYRVLHTPGHTPGGVAFYFEDQRALFGGDTLFRGSVGRVDLPGGDARRMTQSLRRLATLPDDTVVYPGHGETTTIGEEKRTNYFLQPGGPGF